LLPSHAPNQSAVQLQSLTRQPEHLPRRAWVGREIDEPALIFIKRRFIQRPQCEHS
jgi:hypothetical protein